MKKQNKKDIKPMYGKIMNTKDGKVEGKVVYNEYYKKYQVIIDGTVYEEFDTFKEAKENLNGAFPSEKYSRGGHVSKGELVWNKLTSSKKAEFLYENFTPEITPRSQEILVGKAFKFLPKNVKIAVESKYANSEEYATGGELQAKKEQLEKAKRQLAVAKEEDEKSFAEKKIARIEAEIKAMEEKPESKEDFKVETKAEPKESKKVAPKKAVKKTASKKVAEEEVKVGKSDGDFTVKEVETGEVLISSKYHKDWVVTIEEKDGKWQPTCCSDDHKHPMFPSKAKAIEYAKDFLYCKWLFDHSKEVAQKKVEARKKYEAKGGETNVVMTVKNAAETVENKVETIKEEGKAVTPAQANEIDKAIKRIVATIKVAMKSEKDGKAFIKNLISELQKML